MNDINAKKSLTFFLFSEPSFREGVGRIWDFGHSFNTYNVSKTEFEADSRAIYTDWIMVGRDMKQAVKSYERERESETVATR